MTMDEKKLRLFRISHEPFGYYAIEGHLVFAYDEQGAIDAMIAEFKSCHMSEDRLAGMNIEASELTYDAGTIIRLKD